jgi:hypothetical protein
MAPPLQAIQIAREQTDLRLTLYASANLRALANPPSEQTFCNTVVAPVWLIACARGLAACPLIGEESGWPADENSHSKGYRQL